MRNGEVSPWSAERVCWGVAGRCLHHITKVVRVGRIGLSGSPHSLLLVPGEQGSVCPPASSFCSSHSEKERKYALSRTRARSRRGEQRSPKSTYVLQLKRKKRRGSNSREFRKRGLCLRVWGAASGCRCVNLRVGQPRRGQPSCRRQETA